MGKARNCVESHKFEQLAYGWAWKGYVFMETAINSEFFV